MLPAVAALALEVADYGMTVPEMMAMLESWVQDIWPESAIYTLGFRKEAFFNRVLTWIPAGILDLM